MSARRVLAVAPDLFFAVKIAEVAKAAGIGYENVPPAEALARCAASPPDLVLLDFFATPDPFALVRALKADERTRDVPIVGFYQHSKPAQAHEAVAAGIDQMLTRRAFVAKLPEVLAGNWRP